MEEIRRDGEKLVIGVALNELRLIVGAVNEALNGAYAVPVDEWEALIGQPPADAETLLDALVAILER